ncbi:hypothetical protein KIL84_017132 [Mauremys mutica]|uniref:Uncharacterized protein n=1 Tax=Mauremys mutica TaxID=74926 RepID=A0A9D4AWJ4_9SAUR|nr:hypothetical protein KIL84_017132 [Mauremys mutica]
MQRGGTLLMVHCLCPCTLWMHETKTGQESVTEISFVLCIQWTVQSAFSNNLLGKQAQLAAVSLNGLHIQSNFTMLENLSLLGYSIVIATRVSKHLTSSFSQIQQLCQPFAECLKSYLYRETLNVLNTSARSKRFESQ